LTALGWTAAHAKELLDTTYKLARRAVAKARTEGPAAYVVDADRRGGQVRSLLELLALQGIEIQRTTTAATIEESWPPATKKKEEDKDKKDKDAKKETGPKKVEVAAGSYVVRMDQPFSRLADMLLDTQFYRTDDPRPYDDTGWTLGYSKNVNVRRVVNPAILDVAMERTWDLSAKTAPAKGPTALVAEGDIDLYRWLWKAKVNFRIVDAPFKEGDKEIPRGSVLLEDVAENLVGARALSLVKMPEVATRP